MTQNARNAGRRCSLFFLTSLFPACICQAQTGRGTITGLVTDQSGGVIPGANVDTKNLGTGVVQTMKTSSGGLYVFTALVPGNYEVRAGWEAAPRTPAKVVCPLEQPWELDMALVTRKMDPQC